MRNNNLDTITIKLFNINNMEHYKYLKSTSTDIDAREDLLGCNIKDSNGVKMRISQVENYTVEFVRYDDIYTGENHIGCEINFQMHRNNHVFEIQAQNGFLSEYLEEMREMERINLTVETAEHRQQVQNIKNRMLAEIAIMTKQVERLETLLQIKSIQHKINQIEAAILNTK